MFIVLLKFLVIMSEFKFSATVLDVSYVNKLTLLPDSKIEDLDVNEDGEVRVTMPKNHCALPAMVYNSRHTFSIKLDTWKEKDYYVVDKVRPCRE